MEILPHPQRHQTSISFLFTSEFLQYYLHVPMYSFWLQPMAGDHFGSLATGMLLKITMLSPATLVTRATFTSIFKTARPHLQAIKIMMFMFGIHIYPHHSSIVHVCMCVYCVILIHLGSEWILTGQLFMLYSFNMGFAFDKRSKWHD